MMRQLSDTQMKKKAIMMRVSTEASILRAAWLNKVAPSIEEEIDRRIAVGESLDLEMPEIDSVSSEYIAEFFTVNSPPALGA